MRRVWEEGLGGEATERGGRDFVLGDFVLEEEDVETREQRGRGSDMK